jgi:hypothetical protein
LSSVDQHSRDARETFGLAVSPPGDNICQPGSTLKIPLRATDQERRRRMARTSTRRTEKPTRVRAHAAERPVLGVIPDDARAELDAEDRREATAPGQEDEIPTELDDPEENC